MVLCTALFLTMPRSAHSLLWFPETQGLGKQLPLTLGTTALPLGPGLASLCAAVLGPLLSPMVSITSGVHAPKCGPQRRPSLLVLH